MGYLTTALLPGASALLAALAAALLPAVRESVAAFLVAYPFLLTGVGALLALVYRRRRALYALLIVGVATWAGRLAGAADEELARSAVGVTAVLLPANFLALGVCRERSPWSIAGLAGVALVVGQPLLAVFAWHAYLPGFFSLPWTTIFSVDWAFSGRLPDASPVAFTLAFLVLSIRVARGGDPLDGGVLFALVASFWALTGGPESATMQLWLAAAALAVVVSLVSASARWAFCDALTGLPGRRAGEEAITQLGEEFTIAMVDIDHFKRINDRHGHATGDQVLRLVAARLAEVGGGGRAFRWGGEEFLILFANRTLSTTLPFLEAVHRAIASTPFRVRGADRPRRRPRQVPPRQGGAAEVPVTVSMGVSAAERGAKRSALDVVRAADAALYRAKAAGRNRICTEASGVVEKTPA